MTDGADLQIVFEHLEEPISKFTSGEFLAFTPETTVNDALQLVRDSGIAERIFCFYVVDDQHRLIGVIPTRRILCAQLDRKLHELMVSSTVSVAETATIREGCQVFLQHKFLALPVVDGNGRLVGVVDVGFIKADEVDFSERQHIHDMFELIGVSITEVDKDHSPWRAVKYRLPGLVATLIGGVLCAILAGWYQAALEKMLALAFFMTLVTGLSEGISMQSMTITIQHLHEYEPSWKLYFRWTGHEFVHCLPLAIICGCSVGVVASIWFKQTVPAIVIGASICLSMILSSLLGVSIPMLLHALHEDSKIAAGPLTLASADVLTLTLYLKAAAIVILGMS